MGDVVIVSSVRTPVGSFGGTLKGTPVVELGSLVLKEALKRAGLRPVATEAVTQFEPDMFKGVGMVDLEKKAYDLAVKHCDRALALGYHVAPEILKEIDEYRADR